MACGGRGRNRIPAYLLRGRWRVERPGSTPAAGGTAAKPGATATPGASGSTVAVPVAGASAAPVFVSSSTFGGFLNPYSWPGSFRPFAATSVFNSLVPANPKIASYSSAVVANQFPGGAGGPVRVTEPGQYDYSHPVFYATAPTRSFPSIVRIQPDMSIAVLPEVPTRFRFIFPRRRDQQVGPIINLRSWHRMGV